MKYLILSISVLCLGVCGITGKSLSKVQPKKSSETVYKITENKDGSTLTITRPQMEKPTLREITYYHIIERPYKKKGIINNPANEDLPAYEEIRRVFTNGPGFQYGRVKESDLPNTDDNKITNDNNDPRTDGTNQIDIRHGEIGASNSGQGNIEFPKEIADNKDDVASKRRKRDIRYETSVAKREKRENNILGVPGMPDPSSTLYMNKQPAFTNVPNLIGDITLTPNKDENPIRMNGIMPGPLPRIPPYGMGFPGNNGNFWNNFNDPYHVFHYDDNQGFNPEAQRTEEPIHFQPTPNTISSLPNLSNIGTKKNINGSPKISENPVSSKDQGHREESRHPGYGDDPDSRESDDTREIGSWSAESNESDNRSGEASRSESSENSRSSGEDSSSAEHGYGSRESSERDYRKHKEDSLRESKEPNNKGTSESYTDHSEETKKKFDQILSDLHNIFVKSNATVIVPGRNNNLVGSKDAANGTTNDDAKKSNMISVLEGLFTNLIRNTIIVNNNVPVVQTPGFNQQIPGKFHDDVDTTTNGAITNLNSFKDTTENPSNKTEGVKPDEINPELKNGTDPKNFGRPDEVTTFNASKIPDTTDKDMNNNKTVPEEKNNDKGPSSTENPNEDKSKLNKDDDKKSNKTDEKKNNDGGDDSKKHDYSTETPLIDLKDNDCPSNDKGSNDNSRKNKNIDQVVDLMNNDKFWKFMGELSAKYLESLVERTTKLMKEEIAAQMDKYFKEHKPEANNKEIQPKKDEVPNKETETKEKDNVIENTNEGNTTENPLKTNKDTKDNSKKEENKKDHAKENRKNDSIIHVKSHNIYGNTVGNDKVTNIYVFYASKNIDAIMKNIKELLNGNNSTNIFNFEPHGHKHHKGKDEDKHSNGKHKGNDITVDNTDKNGNTATESNLGDKTTKEPNNPATESNIEQPTTDSKSHDTTESTPKTEDSTKPADVTTETAHSTASPDISINPKKEEVTTESTKHETSTSSNSVTDKGNNVTTEAATTQKAGTNDNKNTTGKVEDKKTEGNATTAANNIDVTTEATKVNGTTNSSNITDVSTESPSNKTTTETPHNVTSTEPAKLDVSTIKPNVTDNKAENVTTPTGNSSDAIVTTTEAIKDKANSTENPSTESPNSNNKNETAVNKPDAAKNLTENNKSENGTKITPEKDISLNKTADSKEIDSHNKTTESPTANNSTEITAAKNTTADLKSGNNTTNKPETNKNVTLENKNASENKNGTITSTEKSQEKSATEHKDENTKEKSEGKKDTEENKDKKEHQSSTESSVNKDSSTKKPIVEATTEKK